MELEPKRLSNHKIGTSISNKCSVKNFLSKSESIFFQRRLWLHKYYACHITSQSKSFQSLIAGSQKSFLFQTSLL